MSNININAQNFKKFAKRLQKNSSDSISLMEAQELLAKTFGASNLHNLIQMLDSEDNSYIKKELKINIGNLDISSLDLRLFSTKQNSTLLIRHENLCMHSLILGEYSKREKLLNHISSQYNKNNIHILNSEITSDNTEILRENISQLMENFNSLSKDNKLPNKLIILKDCMLDETISLLCSQIRIMNIGLLFSYTDLNTLKAKASSLRIYESVVSNINNYFVFDDVTYENENYVYRVFLDNLKYKLFSNTAPSKINIEL